MYLKLQTQAIIRDNFRAEAHALNITIRMKNVIEWVLFVKRGRGR